MSSAGFETLGRGVGRRIVLLFLIAGLLPVAFTAGFAYLETSRGWQQKAESSLRATAKERGQELLSRLQSASLAAIESTRLIETGREQDLENSRYLLEFFEHVWIISDDGAARQIHGIPNRTIEPRLDDETSYRTPTRLIIDTRTSPATFLLERITSSSGSARSVLFAVKPEQVWTPTYDVPYPSNHCFVAADGALLRCARPLDTATRRAHIDSLQPGFDSDTDLSTEFLSQNWQLFLAGEFSAPSIQVVSLQPADYAMSSNADFKRVFVPSLILVLLLVGLLSFRLIGNSLLPLQQLTEATHQFAGGRFSTRVNIATKDEFEKLADAFNAMARGLQKQFVMQRSVSEIDKMILSGTSFDEVAGAVLRYVMDAIDCDAVGIVVLDSDTPQWSRLITRHAGKINNVRILTPRRMDLATDSSARFRLEALDEDQQTYTETLRSLGSQYVGIVPIILDTNPHGLLILGFEETKTLEDDAVQHLQDLGDRFAVALSSVNREAALYRQAHFDDLTGLPNRQLLKDRLDQQIRQARAVDGRGALLFLDLDRFKEINDVYGHSTGDIVLSQAADRIVGAVNDTATVARLGGDEFVITLPNATDEDEIRDVATNLLEKLKESFSVKEKQHFLGASMGIVLFPEDGDSAETLLKNADSAMYSAKAAGRGRYEFFSKQRNAQSRRRIELERDLRSAFRDNQLDLYYQPQFDTQTGVICGAEALLRWKRGPNDFVSPAEFIPLAEDSDLIVEIGRWVVKRACIDLFQILDERMQTGPISINVSARQLKDPAFAGDVLGTLADYRIDPRNLQLEVTETAVAENRETAMDLLTSIRSNGVQVALDDFGTGYSSLSYLQQLPFDKIKIDKTFVDRIGDGDASDSICRTIIKMAHELGKQSIAEGVENAEQMEFLALHGCDIIQGYHLSKPLTFDDFLEFMRKQDFHTQRRKALELV